MSRRRSSTKLFSRNEKMIFNEVISVITILINVIIAILKAIPEIINNIKKMVKVDKALKGVGYNFSELMTMIEKISPRQFEVLIGELFKQQGRYDLVELTASTADYGRDVILTRTINGIKEVTFVECKHYAKTNYVAREICQKLLGSCKMFNVEKAIIITTGTFHKNAYEVAGRVNNLQLMDSTDIQEMILSLKPEQISRVMLRTQNAS